MSRKAQGTGSFFVADRSFGARLVCSTFLSANIGAGSVIVASRIGYEVGAAAWWFVGSAGIGQLLFAFFVGPRIWRIAKQHDLLTAGDYLELRYGSAVRATVVSILWLGTLTILATQLIAMSEILEWVLGAPRWVGATLGGITMIIYFTAGGLFTTAWVNLIQLTVLITGFLVAIPIATATAGGIDAVLAAAPADPDYLNPVAIGGLVLFTLLMPSFVVSPGIVQMAFAARDERALRTGVAAQAIILLLFAFVPTTMGILAHSFDPALANADYAVPTVLTLGLPAVLGALGLAAVFSAEASSADTVLFMLSTSMSQDIYKRYVNPDASDHDVLRMARLAAVVGGAGGIALTLMLESVLDSITIFYSILGVSLFVPLVAGLYSRRPGTPEALGAIGCGVTALCAVALGESLGWFGTPAWLNPSGVGLAVSAVAFGLVLVVRKPVAPETS